MKIFTIYHNINKDCYDIKIIKSGFSFIAAIFNIFWALYHRMWFIFIPLICLNIFLKYNDLHLEHNILHTSQFLAFLFFAEEMLAFNLHLKGYKVVDVIYALNEEEAEYKFIQRRSQYEQ